MKRVPSAVSAYGEEQEYLFLGLGIVAFLFKFFYLCAAAKT